MSCEWEASHFSGRVTSRSSRLRRFLRRPRKRVHLPDDRHNFLWWWGGLPASVRAAPRQRGSDIRPLHGQLANAKPIAIHGSVGLMVVCAWRFYRLSRP
jgi:hypothetical protein